MVTAIHHAVSKDIVSLAERQGAGIRLEDLSGIRQSAKQRKARKADAGQNRDDWPFYQLEQLMNYKARLAGVRGEKVPAAYTSQGCHACGRIHRRHACRCEYCGRQAHADANAASGIGKACAVRWFLRLRRTGRMTRP